MLEDFFFTFVGLEFAYRNAPNSMQGLVMAMYFSIISFGSLIGSGLLELSELSGIIPQNSCYNLTYYFFLLGGLMLVSWIIFIIYVERNKRKRSKHRRNQTFKRTEAAISSDIGSIAEIQS